MRHWVWKHGFYEGARLSTVWRLDTFWKNYRIRLRIGILYKKPKIKEKFVNQLHSNKIVRINATSINCSRVAFYKICICNEYLRMIEILWFFYKKLLIMKKRIISIRDIWHHNEIAILSIKYLSGASNRYKKYHLQINKHYIMLKIITCLTLYICYTTKRYIQPVQQERVLDFSKTIRDFLIFFF